MRLYLDFGRLEKLNNLCDKATAYDLTILLRLLARIYRIKAVPTLISIFLNLKPIIRYNTLCLLFRPGTIVYVKQSAFLDNLEQYPKVRRTIFWGPKRGKEYNEYLACVIASWDYIKKDTSANN